jgi:hypothetical protein
LNYNQNFLKYEFQTSWCAESRCHLHLPIAPLVVALQWKVGGDFWKSRVFLSTHTTTALNYNQDFLKGGFSTS